MKYLNLSYEVCFVFKHVAVVNYRSNYDYGTRDKTNLGPPVHQPALFQKYVEYAGCKFFDHLPTHTNKKTHIFKFFIKQILVFNIFYSMEGYCH